MHGVWEILNVMLGSQRALRSLHLYYGDEQGREGNITKDVLQHGLFSALKLQSTISFFKTFMIHHVAAVTAVSHYNQSEKHKQI